MVALVVISALKNHVTSPASGSRMTDAVVAVVVVVAVVAVIDMEISLHRGYCPVQYRWRH
jgi:hypothetical protein